MDTYEGRRRRRFLLGAGAISLAVGAVQSYRTHDAFRSRAREWLSQLAEGVVSKVVSASEQYVDTHIGVRNRYSLEATLLHFSRDYFREGTAPAERLELMARRHIMHDIVRGVFSAGSEALRHVREALPAGHPLAADEGQLSSFIVRELTGYGTRLSRLARGQSIERTLQHVAFSRLHRDLGGEAVRRIAAGLAGSTNLMDEAMEELRRSGWFARARDSAISGLAEELKRSAQHGERLMRRLEHIGATVTTAAERIERVFPADATGQRHPLLQRLRAAGVDERVLQRIPWEPKIRFTATGREYSLDPVIQAYDHMVQWARHSLTVPIAPGMATISPFRLFPWRERFRGHMAHLQFTTRQGALSTAFGRAAGDPIGHDVLLIGERAIGMRVGLSASGGDFTRAFWTHRAGESLSRAGFVVEGKITEPPGRFGAYAVRGQALREVLSAMTGARERAIEAGDAAVPQTALRTLLRRWEDHPVVRWLGLHRPNDVDYYVRKASAFLGQKDPEHPLNLLSRLHQAAETGVGEGEHAQLVSDLRRLSSFMKYNTRMDVDYAIGRLVEYYDKYAQAGNPPIERDQLSRVFGRSYFGHSMIDLLRAMSTRESAIAAFSGRHEKVRLTRAMLSTFAADPNTPQVLRDSVQELLHNPGFAQMDRRIHSSHLLSELADNLRGIADLRDSIDRFREGVFLAAMMGDARTGASLLHEVFPVGKHGEVTTIQRLAEGLFDALEKGDRPLVGVADLWKRVRDERANAEVAAFVLANMLHDVSEAPGVLGSNITPVLQAAFRGRNYNALRSTLQRMAGGRRTWLREAEVDIGDSLLVLPKLQTIARDQGGRIDLTSTASNLLELARSAFTTDPARVSMASVPTHFFALRLNQMLIPYGLGLPEYLTRTPGQAYLNLLVRRVLPAALVWEGFRFIDHLMHAATRTSPSSIMAGALGTYVQGMRSVADSLHITPVSKWLAGLVPGVHLYWHPRDREEERLYQQYGFTPVRRGRWWLLGSRSPLHGENVEAFVPHFIRRMRSDWQAASNVDLMGGDWLMHQWWFNPIGAFGDPHWWVRKHRKDRPYPVGGRLTDVYTPVGALAGVVDPGLAAHDIRAATMQGRAARDNFYRLAMSTVSDSPVFLPIPERARVTLATSRQRGIAQRIKRGRGAVRAQMEEFGIDAPGLKDGSVPVLYPYDARFRVAGAMRAVGELQGIYGWMGSLFVRPRTVLRWDDPGWAMSRSRQFWESRFGGFDPIPWMGELNEFVRRFLLRREASDVRVNPLPNNMPAWLPGDLSPGVNFRRGDPYAKIIRGELRLPGEAYRRVNPFVFRRDLLAARASMLGKSRREMLETFLGLRSMQGDTGGYAALYGTRVHKLVQTELARQGLLLEEEREYADPVHQIYGHPDLVLRDRNGRILIGEIKTMGRDRFRQRRIFYEHYIQLQQYLYMTRARKGILIYINRDDPSQIAQFRVSYNPVALQRAWDRLRSVRWELRRALRSGELNEGALYSDLTRFEILSDVAPFSPMWRTYQRVLQARFISDPGEVTSVDQYRYQMALEHAAMRRKANLTYPYMTREPRHVVHGVVSRVTDTGLIYLRGVERPVRLAGIHLDYVKMARLMRVHGITVDEQYNAIGVRTGNLSRRSRRRRAAALRRLRETHEAQRVMGVSVQALYSAYGIEPGARITVSTVQPLLAGYSGAAGAVVSVHGSSNVARLMVRQGVARWTENILTPMDYQARYGGLARLFARVPEWLAHRDTMLHNKLFRVRSPVEEYERSHVYGSQASFWEHPFRSFVWPTITGIAAKHPVQAFLYGSLVTSLFFAPRRLKVRGALWGGSIMALISLWVHLHDLMSVEPWKPKRVRKREEIEEYYDLLTYLKYRRLYLQEVAAARRLEHVDIDRLISELHRHEKRGRRAIVERGPLGVPVVRRVRDALSRHQPLELGTHAQRALLYRSLYERTLVAQTDLRQPPALASIPRRRRELIIETAEYGTPQERRRLYRLLPAHERRVVGHLLLGKRGRRSFVDIERAMRKYTIPDSTWLGWRPEVDLEMLKIRTMQEEGLDPIDVGVSTREARVANALTQHVEVPVYRSRYQSPAHVRAQLHRLARDLEADWYDVRTTSASGRLTAMAGIVRINVERDSTGYLEEQLDALE